MNFNSGAAVEPGSLTGSDHHGLTSPVHAVAAPLLDTPVLAPAGAGAILALIAAAELALRYLDHPDVQAIPFARPASSVVELLRAAIAGVRA